MFSRNHIGSISVKTTTRRAAAAALAMTIGVTAASPTTARAQGAPLPPVAVAAVKGDINIGGSITVNVLTQRVADKFTSAGYAGKFTIASESTGEGIRRFCTGEVDFTTALLPMTPEQIALCAKNGRTAVQMPIAIDAMVFAVSRKNTFAGSLTRQNLADIYSGKATSWQDINSEWVDAPIKAMSMTPDLAGYDYVTDQLYKSKVPDVTARKAIIKSTATVALHDKPFKVARAIQRDDYAVGYIPYNLYADNRTRLRTVPIEGVIANDKTVANRSYQFTRTGTVIFAPEVLKQKPQIAAFINFYLANSRELALPAGMFPEPTATFEKSKALFLDALD